ncbi:Glu/Leu/Phe/Val family dehydrogenase [Candidatus Clavichlamydia salmonicola]|uniref:Glu/Leu/Phe/Val family dehydrogenase n=1 Tax=Candidatus Clavichlamydia salmonicola TaxID=469812 RepID=UPI0018915762|nr:Glu/Leu/Phe/Val dehydrogenase [Candidatus Clavichlamydia salmonicola]
MVFSDLFATELSVPGYERVVRFQCTSAGLDAIIAVHNTTLGVALGGTRAFPFESFDDALKDVLRLSKGMTYKAALAGTHTGGGKSVIILKPGTQVIEESLLQAFAEAVNQFEGRYICAEDVGIGLREVNIIKKYTSYVAGLPGKSGDPSIFTARGVFQSIRAAATTLWGSPSLNGKKIAIQGLGHVGMHLAAFLFWEGVDLIVADLRREVVDFAQHTYGASVVSPEELFEKECDILAPCALGSSINIKNIPNLLCKAVVGAANNQLENDQCAQLLKDKNILYIPDYLSNAGGLINVAIELLPNGYDPVFSQKRVNNLFESIKDLLNDSLEHDILPLEAANKKVSKILGIE